MQGEQGEHDTSGRDEGADHDADVIVEAADQASRLTVVQRTVTRRVSRSRPG
jgi:hypothetical protein